jgi:AcrR family transcriptional regulator
MYKTRRRRSVKRSESRYWLHQRKKILSAAERLFWQKGYLGTSIQDIANAANISKSSIYYYSKNKAGLLYEIEMNAQAELEEMALPVMNSELPAQQKLEILLKNHMKWVASHRGLAGVSQVERKNLPPKLMKIIIDRRDEYESFFRKSIESIMEQMSSEFSSHKLVSLFVLGLANSINQWYKPNGELTDEEIASNVYAFICKALGITK